MAIKGKKKSQNRGSQARRKPAMAPRPAPGKAQKPPWYKTTAGQTIAAISAMILVLVILVSVNNARTEARERDQLESSYDAYTDQARSLLQNITGPASEMAAAAQTAPEDLAASAKDWNEAFVGAQTQVSQLLPPEDASASHELFAQSMGLFASAANTFTAAAELEGDQQTELLTAASAQVSAASQVWSAGVTVLDEALDANDLPPSGLRSPTEAPPSGMPTPEAEATVPVEPDDAGDDAGAGDDGNGGGGNNGGKGGGSKRDNGSGG